LEDLIIKLGGALFVGGGIVLGMMGMHWVIERVDKALGNN